MGEDATKESVMLVWRLRAIRGVLPIGFSRIYLAEKFKNI